MTRRRSEVPTAQALRSRDYRDNRETPEARERRLRMVNCRRHGIDLEKFEQLLVMQKERCKACNEPLRIGERFAVHIDHDTRCCSYEEKAVNGAIRTCGNCIRGLLCHPCNRAIGLMERYGHRVHNWMAYIRSAERVVWEEA